MKHLVVPQIVAVCPYCSSSLTVEPQEWDDLGRIISVTIYCDADLEAFEQHLMSDKRTDYDEASHPCGYDPDWMAAAARAERWARTQRVSDA